jgi:hypothetical protein
MWRHWQPPVLGFGTKGHDLRRVSRAMPVITASSSNSHFHQMKLTQAEMKMPKFTTINISRQVRQA